MCGINYPPRWIFHLWRVLDSLVKVLILLIILIIIIIIIRKFITRTCSQALSMNRRRDPSSRLATIDMGRKLGAPPPFWGGGSGSPSNTMWPGVRRTCTPSFILIHPTVWLQYTRQTDRTGQDRLYVPHRVGQDTVVGLARLTLQSQLLYFLITPHSSSVVLEFELIP